MCASLEGVARAFALFMEVATGSFGSFALLDLLTFLVKQEALDNTQNKVETKNCQFFLL
jgi:hypothetical protein